MEMSGGGMSPELFHIEHYGGDEEDMKAEKVNATISFTASRRSDDLGTPQQR